MRKKQMGLQKYTGRGLTAIAVVVFLLLGAVVATVFSVVGRAQAATGVYKTINFQGKVVNTNGTNVADTSYTFKFRIYSGTSGDTGATCASTCLWEESKSLTTTNGIFQTNLGDTTSLPGSVNFNTDNLYVAVVFNGDTEMTPRIRLTSVPYAFNADMLDGLDSTQLVQLSPGSQQTGAINVSGNITTAGNVNATGSVNAASIDAATSGALQIGGANATGITLAKNTTMSSSYTLSLQGNNALNLGSTSAAGGIIFKDGTANNRAVTLSTVGLTASYTLNLPSTGASAGLQCLQTASGSTTNLAFGSCGAGGTNVSLQAGSPGTADIGNFNVTGVGIAAALYAPSFDQSSAGLLNIGTNTANQIIIGKGGLNITLAGTTLANDISVQAGKSITFVAGAGNFDQSASTGTFKTGTGAVTINGDETHAAGKSITFVAGAGNFDQSGSTGTFATGSGTVGLNGNTTVAGTKSLTVTAGPTSLTGLAAGSSTAISIYTGAASNIGSIVKGVTSQAVDLFQLQDVSGNVNASFNSAGNSLTLGRVAASGTVTAGNLLFGDGTTDNFSSTIKVGGTALTASQTINLGNQSGTVCLQGSANCGFATGTSGSYIQNQIASAQTGANFWINGTGAAASFQASTNVLTPLLDTPSGVTSLAIGTTNATAGINLNQNTLLAAGKNLTFTAGAGGFDQSASTGTFATGSGAVGLNGNTTIANNKTFSAGGDGLFKAATDSTTAFRVQNASGANLLTADTANMGVAVNNGALSVLGLTSPGTVTLASISTTGTLTAGTYYYKVEAFNGSGHTPAIASTPAFATTTGSASKNTITWTQVTGAAGYYVFRSNDGGTTWYRNTISGSGTLTAIDNGSNFTWTGTTYNQSTPNMVSNTTSTLNLDTNGNLNFGSNVNLSNFGNYFSVTNTSASGVFVVQSDSFLFQDTTGYNNNLAIANNGATTFKNRVNSSTAFVIQNASGNQLFTADTSTGNLTLGKASTLSTSLIYAAGAGNFDQSASTGTFATGSGAVSLNGDTTIASGKALTVNGLTTIKADSATAFRVQNAAGTTTLFNFDTTAGNLTLASGATRTIAVGAATGAGNNLALTAGAAGGTNQNGGNVVLTGGAGIGTGVQGLVQLSSATFATAPLQTNTITAGIVDQYSTVPVTANAANLTINIPSPVNAVTGRILYLTAVGGSNDFTIVLGGTSISIAMKQNSTATLIWNGTGWTAAGASSSTDLQSAYNNTLTSAGGAELVLNGTGGNADGFTIRNNATSPLTGGLLEVQSSIGNNILSVNQNASELAANGGAETSGTFTTSWLAYGAATISRNTTAANNATGLASAQVVTPATANTGVKNNLVSNPAVSTTYQVSMTGKLSAGTFTTLDVEYSRNGGTTLTNCDNSLSATLVTTGWSKITCTFTTDATAATDPDIIVRQTDATARTFWIDNLSVTILSATSTPPNVQIGGGLYGGAATVLTLDRASSAPVAIGNQALLGSMYYDTTSGRIQCYEADGWGACGSSPDNYVNLVPEFSGAVLNGTGIGTMTSDFCSNQSGILQVNLSLCSTGQALNFYKWTSPQATQQTYSVYVTYQLPAAFKQFQSDSTVQLTARTDSTTNGIVSYEMFRSQGGALTACGTETTVTSGGANQWWTVGINGNELSGCGFSSASANNFAIFKINVKAKSNANVYVGTLSFTTTGQ